MANETQIGKLVIDLQLKTQALEAGLKKAKEELEQIETENKRLQESNSQNAESFVMFAAKATAALYSIRTVLKASLDDYKQYTQAMSALDDVAKYTNNDMSEFNDIMNDFSKYMTKADIAATIKNFSLMGMSVEQTRKMMEALTNSAIKNRNANYSVSEAVKVASDGYKQGLSTLSDSAGVTENLSVMLDKYAESIGKTVSQLSQEEINQAYVNRTMEAAAPFASAMSEYNESLAAKQAEFNNQLEKTSVAYGSAVEPAYSAMLEQVTGLVGGIGEFISNHKTLTSAMSTFIVTLTATTVAVMALKKAKDAYTKSTIAATIAEKGFAAALMANPLLLVVGTIATAVTGISVLTSTLNQQREEQEALNRAQENYNAVLKNTIELNGENKSSVTTTKDLLQEYVDILTEVEDRNSAIQTLEVYYEQLGLTHEEMLKLEQEQIGKNVVLKRQLEEYSDQLFQILGLEKNENNLNADKVLKIEKATEALEAYTKVADEFTAIEQIKNATDVNSIKNQQQQAAQLKIEVKTLQEYLDVVRQGQVDTTEYQNAVKKLVEAYPEAANAEGIIIDKMQDLINLQSLEADQAWNTSQEMINDNIAVIQTFIEMANAAGNSADMQAQLAQSLGIEYSQIIPTLTSVLNILQMIGNQEPTQVPGIAPSTVSTPRTTTRSSSGSGGSSSYQNKKLDNYKKEIEYKKSLDQLSLQDEINMYQYALDALAKTTDEKNDLRVKIYELNKEMAEKERDLVNQQTKEFERAMEDQKKARGSAYDVSEQRKDYDKLIEIHRNYLHQVMEDTRLSYEQRKEIYEDELETIRDYEQQKRDLMVSSIDDTVSKLSSAIIKQLKEMQSADEELINKNLKAVAEWKKQRIDAINAEYDARLEAIQRELDLLDQSEKEKTRAEEDAEYERKKNRLQELIDFEHDETNKANYQKELNNLVIEYQKILDNRALADKRESLEEQKELLKNEQDLMIDNIETEANKQTEALNEQLTAIDNYYTEQMNKADETAQQMLLNVEANQDKILALLEQYENAYEITGQSLGEKLAQGINEGVASKIIDTIQTIQDTFDANINSKINAMVSGMYQYNPGIGKPTVGSSIVVNQTNNIQQNPEMPSETYRKLNNVSEKLAEELAGL